MFGRRWNPVTDIPDLTGRVAIVTGANIGLGYQTALQLANHGATVYLTTRSEAKALDTIKRLEEANPSLTDSGRLRWLELDLTLVHNAKAAAEEFLKKEARLDILVNNAGQMAADFEVTAEGLSHIMASDHVSPFAFTTALLPLLEKTARLPDADVRVVTISSIQHSYAPTSTKFVTPADFRDMCGPEESVNSSILQQTARYGQAKLANILFARELQRRWDAAGIPGISISLHPGVVHTAGAERVARSFGAGILWPLVTLFIMTPPQGAITQLFAATSPDVRQNVEKYKGQYLVPYGSVATPSAMARREGLAEELWNLSEKVVQEILEKGKID
ncbi:daunorubicin C-13 ketoreductase [Dacryopinax primogenitus]|uniref:Daunorubicin C-13 ketoreductase n=1 Tax=Dacryopinax primogenitus (strain DJM 731) TaxID=1858805 RepID=M5G2P7_DACPD|nr:daunorubicin C-13 ketoreductase [Dacryopinax primogenitus]EJT98037.1 daunorubicin C-13 ketoreductase [Dacryopinax primogenitus]